MPPESPVPGWSIGDVWKLNMATRGRPGRPDWIFCITLMVRETWTNQARPVARTGSICRWSLLGSAELLADLLGCGLHGLGVCPKRLADARGRRLDLGPRGLRLLGGSLRGSRLQDAAAKALA